MTAPFDPATLWDKLVDKGYSEQGAKGIVDEHIRRAKLATSQEDMDAVNFGTTALMGFGQTASLGFSDELAGAASAAPKTLPGGVSPQSAYYAGRDADRAAYARGVAQHPMAAILGEAAGVLATLPLFAAAQGMRGAQALPSAWAAAQAGMKGGAAAGALAGAGNAEELSDVPAGMAMGAAGGAVVGGLMGAAGNKAAVASEVNAGKLARSKSAQMRAKADELRLNHPDRPASQKAAHDAIKLKPEIQKAKLEILQQKKEMGANALGQQRIALADYLANAPTDQLRIQVQFAEGSPPGFFPQAVLNAAKTELARRTGAPGLAPGSTPTAPKP